MRIITNYHYKRIERLTRKAIKRNKKRKKMAEKILLYLADPKASITLDESIIRKKAIEALGDIGEASVVSKLVALLPEMYHGFGRSAAAALGKIDIKSTAKPLSDVMLTGKSGVAVAASKILAESANKYAVDDLIKALDGMVVDGVMENAAAALGKIGDKKAIDPLIRTLTHPNEKVRKSAATALKRLGRDDLADVVRGKKGDLRELGKMKNPALYDSFIKVLDSEHSTERNDALLALGEHGDPRAIESILPKFNKFEAKNVVWTLEQLGEPGDKRIIDLLKRYLACDNGDIRKYAAKALNKFGESQWQDIIKGSNVDFDRLIATKDKLFFDLFFERLKSLPGSPYPNFGQAKAVIKTGDKRLLKPTRKLLEHGNCDGFAVWALCELKDRHAAQPLLKELSSAYTAYKREDDLWRVGVSTLGKIEVYLKRVITIIKALGDIGDESAGEKLELFLEHNSLNNEMEKAIRLALGKIRRQKSRGTLGQAKE